jgi:hypothetical protein
MNDRDEAGCEWRLPGGLSPRLEVDSVTPYVEKHLQRQKVPNNCEDCLVLCTPAGGVVATGGHTSFR